MFGREFKLKRLKEILDYTFPRRRTEDEYKEVLSMLEVQSREVHEKLPGFTESRYVRYLGGASALFFSPGSIFHELRKIISEIDADTWNKERKYKRAKEMSIATRLSLGLKKLRREEWMIKSDDTPDIILARPSGSDWYQKPFNAVPVEIMAIPTEEAAKWSKDFSSELVSFVEKKKFSKHYWPQTILLVDLNFNYQGIDVQGISERIQEIEFIPYHQIWMTGIVSPTENVFMIGVIYPEFKMTTIDVDREKELLF